MIRRLNMGCRGSDVVRWQRLLGVHATGLFDVATHEATVRFQERCRLPTTGRVDEETLRMAELCRRKTDPQIPAIRPSTIPPSE